jgi:hypothetical protein
VIQVDGAFGWLLFFALAIPLALATCFGTFIMYNIFFLKDRRKERIGKTIDKLAQLLSEQDNDGAKMSLSRVQALIFT